MLIGLLVMVGLGPASSLGLPVPASLGVVITDGTIALGVAPLGNLGAPSALPSKNCGSGHTTINYVSELQEGMDCDLEGEGWGLAYDGGAVHRWAGSGVLLVNTLTSADGLKPLAPDLVSFTVDSSLSTAVSVALVGDVQVTHDYHPVSGVPNAYAATITITNTGNGDHNDVRYRRLISWGSATTGGIDDNTLETLDLFGTNTNPTDVILERSAINSYSAAVDPTVALSPVVEGPPGADPVVDFTPVGDYAATFDISIEKIRAGESKHFSLYYGASTTAAGAIATLHLIKPHLIYNLNRADPAAPRVGPFDDTFFMAIGDVSMKQIGCKYIGWMGPAPPVFGAPTRVYGAWSALRAPQNPHGCRTDTTTANTLLNVNSWISIGASCKGIPVGVSVAGVYCGPTTTGTFTCAWNVVSGTPLGVTVAVDRNADGIIDGRDRGGFERATQKAPMTSEFFAKLDSFDSTGGPIPFPAGRIMAFPMSSTAAFDPSVSVDIICV